MDFYLERKSLFWVYHSGKYAYPVSSIVIRKHYFMFSKNQKYNKMI